MKKRTIVLGIGLWMCISALSVSAEKLQEEEFTEASSMEAITTFTEDEYSTSFYGCGQYEIICPTGLDEVLDIMFGVPELNYEEGIYFENIIMNQYLEAAKEIGSFEKDFLELEEKFEMKCYFLDTDQVDQAFVERLKDPVVDGEVRSFLDSYVEIGEEPGIIRYKNEELEYSGSEFAIVFCDYRSNEPVMALVGYHHFDRDYSSFEISEEILTQIVESIGYDDDYMMDSSYEGTVSDTEFDKEEFEKTAAFQDGTWEEMEEPASFGFYAPAGWEVWHGVYLPEVGQNGSAIRPPEEEYSVCFMGMRAGVSLEETFAGVTENEIVEDVEEIEINSLECISYVTPNTKTKWLLYREKENGPGVAIWMSIDMFNKYEDYLNTICDSIHIVNGRGGWDESNYVDDADTSVQDADTVREVQQALNSAGYDCGTADGVMGSKTSEAIQKYQQDHSLTVDGTVSDELLTSLGL